MALCDSMFKSDSYDFVVAICNTKWRMQLILTELLRECLNIAYFFYQGGNVEMQI